MVTISVTYAVAADPEAFFGRWKQTFEKSGGTIQPPVTSATVEIKPMGNRVSVSMSEKSEAGATNSDEYIFSLDGSPVKNAAGVETGRSFRQLDSTVWEWTNKTPQQQTTGHYVISKDGKTLTITGRRQRSDGSTGYFHRVFEKQ
jgi:hypothetical protein